MPIYAYRCEHCGHAQDVLQKVSDPVLSVCPACGHETFRKQVTAAGFQLKGSGWYVTDFRGDGKKGGSKPVDGEKADGAGKGDDKPAADGAPKGDAAPAPAPGTASAPAPAPTPSAKSGGSS